MASRPQADRTPVVRLLLNQAALSIEEIISKMHRTHLSLADILADQLRESPDAIDEVRTLQAASRKEDPKLYNNAYHFQTANERLLRIKEKREVATLSAEMETAAKYTLEFADLAVWRQGLRAVIGAPPAEGGDVRERMRQEHCDEPTASNRISVQAGKEQQWTCPALEWWFVLAPERGPSHLGIGVSVWPLCASQGGTYRKPTRLAEYEPVRSQRNQEIVAAGGQPLSMEHVIATRLYTGKMYSSYSAILRGVRPPYTPSSFAALLCAPDVAERAARGELDEAGALSAANKYTTTILELEAALHRLSCICKSGKVYRGLQGARLPTTFLHHDANGFRGAVERGFMSVTRGQDVAVLYAIGHERKPCVMLEIDVNMCTRPADVQDFSQYPHEKEELYPPLTAIIPVRERLELVGDEPKVPCIFLECEAFFNWPDEA